MIGLKHWLIRAHMAITGREDIEYLCHLASYDEVKEQDYNLSVSFYVEAEDTGEKIDQGLEICLSTMILRSQDV